MRTQGAIRANALPAIGFLTVLTLPDRAFVGGYLVLTSTGRPLEFHCTAPVRANRAQEILYGPTLRPYICGDQIGKILLSRPKTRPMMALTDVQDVLAARSFSDLPVLFVMNEEVGGNGQRSVGEAVDRRGPQSRSCPGSATATQSLIEFALGGYRVAVSPDFRDDQTMVTQQWQTHLAHLDLREPFSRIHEAIQEAQNSR